VIVPVQKSKEEITIVWPCSLVAWRSW